MNICADCVKANHIYGHSYDSARACCGICGETKITIDFHRNPIRPGAKITVPGVGEVDGHPIAVQALVDTLVQKAVDNDFKFGQDALNYVDTDFVGHSLPADRIFEQVIFMGNGSKSGQQIKNLMRRVGSAGTILSALQQNGGMGGGFDAEMDRQLHLQLEIIARDVLAALGFDEEIVNLMPKR